nr:hypothetical protein [Tanacetum cinerariifolium]
MERMKERLGQFVDHQMTDLMNNRRPRNLHREDEEPEENSFGDGSSSDEQSIVRPRRNQWEDNRRWESRMRVNILYFDEDTLNPEGFVNWIAMVEEVFEFKEVPENKKVSLIATKLRGRAFVWWQQMKLTRERVGKSKITGVSSSGNAVSYFAPNQAKVGVGNTRPFPKATDSSRLKCFNCGEPGHRQSECKKARKRKLFPNLEDNDDDVTYVDYEATLIYNDDYVSGDMGVNLVIKRSCLTPKADEDDWLKHNIFQLTCTILGKGGEVTVSKHVHVSFSVGTTYKDNVWCDVVAMDACHLLLGRPWEYDLDITPNRKTNTYSFLFGGVKNTLMPNKPKEVVNKPSGTLLTLSQFEDELEIMEKMNSNAYRLKLPSHIRRSDVFNVKHLLPY